MSEFEFVEELPSRSAAAGRSRVSDAFAEALKARPGEWAVWPRSITQSTAYRYVHQIRTGKLLSFAPEGTFDAATRSGVLYVRYIGVPTDV